MQMAGKKFVAALLQAAIFPFLVKTSFSGPSALFDILKNCSGKVAPNSWTAYRVETVGRLQPCALSCLGVNTTECASLVFKDGVCSLYSEVAEGACGGFSPGVGAIYFEPYQQCTGGDCVCTKYRRGETCAIRIGDAAAFHPMDEVKAGELVGLGVKAAVYRGHTLVPGVQGKALVLKYPGYVNMGNQRHRCLGSPEKCPNGFTLAMWLYVSGTGTDQREDYFLQNGATTASANGGMAVYFEAGQLRFRAKTSTRYWKVTLQPKIVYKIWYHLGMTWSLSDGLNIYVNGTSRATDKAGIARTPTGDFSKDLTLGAPANNLGNEDYFGEGIIDDLIFWSEQKPPTFLLDLFKTPNYGA